MTDVAVFSDLVPADPDDLTHGSFVAVHCPEEGIVGEIGQILDPRGLPVPEDQRRVLLLRSHATYTLPVHSLYVQGYFVFRPRTA